MIYYKGERQVTRYTTRSGSGHMIYYKVRVRSHDILQGQGQVT